MMGLAINSIESFFANLPDHLKTEGVLGAGEPFLTIRIPSAFECKHDWRHSGNHDNEYFDLRGHGAGQADLLKFTGGHAGDAGNPWRAVVDVRKFDWGEGTDNAFEGTTHSDACEGDTSSEGCAGDRLLYDLREGVSRLFEQAYTYRQRRLRHRINNRVSDDQHWLRHGRRNAERPRPLRPRLPRTGPLRSQAGQALSGLSSDGQDGRRHT